MPPRIKNPGPPTCGHPLRAYHAKGMCKQCYLRDYDKKHRVRKDPSELSPNYRKPPHKPARIPDCHPDQPHKAKGLCTSCYLKQRESGIKATCHPERPHIARGFCATCISREQYDADPETARRHARESGKRVRERNRTELLAAYGGKCACPRCPETNDAFLTLEHIGGGGREHRKAVGSHTYADLRRRGWPQEGYTLLCWNCNSGSRFTGVCPHMMGEQTDGL
jgi:hypothetical protein